MGKDVTYKIIGVMDIPPLTIFYSWYQPHWREEMGLKWVYYDWYINNRTHNFQDIRFFGKFYRDEDGDIIHVKEYGGIDIEYQCVSDVDLLKVLIKSGD